ncbi:hypothetical protein E4U19_001763 [Claviceps sp. Clav32 group G5]|nr:hypothetical protein E4U19_001763 [Claviceps sp. Clav32 group G5]
MDAFINGRDFQRCKQGWSRRLKGDRLVPSVSSAVDRRDKAMVGVQQLAITPHNIWKRAIVGDSHLCFDVKVILEGTLEESKILNGGSEVICLVDDLSKESVLSHEYCRVSSEGTVHGLNEVTWADILVATNPAIRLSKLLLPASNISAAIDRINVLGVIDRCDMTAGVPGAGADIDGDCRFRNSWARRSIGSSSGSEPKVRHSEGEKSSEVDR